MQFERLYTEYEKDLTNSQRKRNEILFEPLTSDSIIYTDSSEYVKKSDKKYKKKYHELIPRSSKDGSRIWYFRYINNKGLDPFREDPNYTILTMDSHYKGKIFKKFSVFYSPEEVIEYIKNTPEENRIFNVLIQENQPCRIYLDYDFYLLNYDLLHLSDQEIEDHIEEEIDNRLNEILEIIPKVFKDCFNKKPGLMYIFDSSYDNKISFHIEFDRYYVNTNWEIAPFVYALHKVGLTGFDPSVYKRNQQWRCPYNHKVGSPNYKYLIDDEIYLPVDRYLITDIRNCSLITPSKKCIDIFEMARTE